MMNNNALLSSPGGVLNAGRLAPRIESMVSVPGLLLLSFAFCLAAEKRAWAGPSAAAEAPVAKFTDITREAGITFSHVNAAYGDKLLPQTMGGRVAFFDFDNDGFPDLLFVNSCYCPSHSPAGRG